MAGGNGDSQNGFLKVTLQDTDISSRVRSVEVEDNDRLMDRAVLRLDLPTGPDTETTGGNMPRENQRVLVELGWADEHAVVFEGLVGRAGSETRGGQGEAGTITAFDYSSKMKNLCRVSEDHVGKLKEILTRVVERNAVQIGEIKPNPDRQYTAEAPLRQTQVYDWDFIQDVALQEGARAFVEYNGDPETDGASKFYWVSEEDLLHGDPQQALHYCPGFHQVVEFNYRRIASGAAVQQTATTTDPATGDPVTTPPPPTRPPETTPSPITGSEGTPDQQRPVADVRGRASATDAASQTVRADPTRILGYFGEGRAVGTVHLRAKGKVSILGIAAWAEGDWYVRKVTHVFTRTGAREQNASSYEVKFVVTR